MGKNRLSITDLAKRLNISITTVSFILNGKAKEKRISEDLVKRVQQEALKLGYQPNQFAKSLRTGRTNIIGLMVEDISNPFYASIAKMIEEKVYENGYKIVYCSTENDKNRGKEFLTMFSTLGVDGCIIAPTMGMEKDIKELTDNGMKVVLFDRKFSNRGVDAVMVNNVEGMYNAVTHLVERGFNKIGLIALALDKPEKEDRIIGYTKAMTDHRLKPVVFPLPFKVNYLDYVSDIRAILCENTKLDAVIFGTNYLGISGLEAISQLKLKIPRDIAVISFDDHDLFRIHKPSITVIAQPIEEIAQTVIDRLLMQLKTDDNKKAPDKNKTVKSKTISLSTSLIARDSTVSVK